MALLAPGDINAMRSAIREELARGKTKIIHALPDFPKQIIMENLDAIGAQDGGKTDYIAGKAKASTQITSNVFEYLESKGVATHFQKQLSDTEILVDKCDMIPLECVFRFVTTGSHYRREKHLLEGAQDADGTVLDTPIMEFFYKHDVYSGGNRIADPLMECENGIPKIDTSGNFILLNPSTGEQIEYTDVYHAGTDTKLDDDEREKDKSVIIAHATKIREQTVSVGEKLKDFYSEADIEVLDGKIEFGIAPNGDVVVADVIDADSCRLRKPTVLEDQAGNRYLGKEFTKDEVYRSLIDKYFTPIERLRELQSLITDDAAPYSDTLDIIEKHCSSEPGKYEEALSEFQDKDGNIDFAAFRRMVVEKGNFKGTRMITRFLLQDVARKKAEELEFNYSDSEIFRRNENGNMLFDTLYIQDAKAILKSQIDDLGEYDETIDFSRIVEGEGFDKQGYREGEELEATKSKYDKLAKITKGLLKKLGIGEIRTGIAGKVVQALA